MGSAPDDRAFGMNVRFWTAIVVAGWLVVASPAQSPRRFVQEFYNWYTPRALKGDALATASRQRKSDFSPTLWQALEFDRRAQANHPGQIAGLDLNLSLTPKTRHRAIGLGRSRGAGRTFSFRCGQ